MILQTAATMVTALGVLLGALTLRASQRQRLRQLESFYVERYWKIMDSLSLKVVRGEVYDPLTETDEKAILAYLRLCEDECELRAQGWIADATWSLWRDGMRDQLDLWPFAKVWGSTKSSEFTQLQKVMKPGQDVAAPALPRRLVRGLTGGPGV